jgi:hypothetical protein
LQRAKYVEVHEKKCVFDKRPDWDFVPVHQEGRLSG